MFAPLPTADEIEHHLELAARGIVLADGLVDERWEPVLMGVARRGVVTAADHRAVARLLAALDAEAARAD
ncbi:hypothetical protein [Protaetiibacter mangrovi]|uniref:Uncharacterized protein n=1 Tax=Protaetiibacter mangrovi TaxID=2970926 RepID=A0ABT1ZJ59_9MICO|nr:hypothetical protein [Protaetiibacter mangrovi]MCS0500760.1 hypothetical protein [Protaetiibacter mangrovi]